MIRTRASTNTGIGTSAGTGTHAGTETGTGTGAGTRTGTATQMTTRATTPATATTGGRGRAGIPFVTAVFTAAVVLAAAGWGCSERPDDWSPVLEETSTTFLETETQRVLNDVTSALEQLQTHPDQAEAALQQAIRSLEAINDFYLPLFQAREKAYNAFRYLRLGDRAQVTRELETIEATLTSMVQKAEGGPLAELQVLAEAVADARVAVEAGGDEGAAAVEELGRKLNQAVLKGDLILR